MNFFFSQIIELKESVDDIVQNSSLTNPQNYIVYFLVISIFIYILFGIYLSRKEQSNQCLGRKHSISFRRGR
jgi:hypothetical protein